MSSSALMSIGMRSMTANYAALQTTGHNIANATVEGYSRQEVQLATASGQFNGAGFFGKGVDVKAVERMHDEYLTREAAMARSMRRRTAPEPASSSSLKVSSRPVNKGWATPLASS